MRIVIVVLLLALLPIAPLAADTKGDANAAYVAKQWSEAGRLYAEVVKADPTDGQAWYRIGTAHHQLGRLDEAIAAYLRASELKFAPPYTSYNLAAAYALNKDAANAYVWLEKAFNTGYSDEASLASDTDLASVRDTPRFRELVAQLEQRLHPCRASQYRQLDFWVGEWTVRDTRAGHTVGTSSIQRILDDCVILENWTGALGGVGKSFNTFDSSTKKWRQTWTDSSGQIVDFSGEPAKERMVYQRASQAPDGKPVMNRMTLSKLPTGEVQQLSEQSQDGGKSWSVGFDFTYKAQ